MRLQTYILLLILTACAACGETDTGTVAVGDLPRVAPEMMWETAEAGTLFFGHLGYNSVAREDGSFLVYDRQLSAVLHISPEGELLEQLTRKGRGPGEVGDIISLTGTGDGGVLVHEQSNDKVLRFNGDLELQSEFLLSARDGDNPVGIYGGVGDSTYIVRLNSSLQSLREDPMSDMGLILAHYNSEDDRYGKSMRVLGSTFAPQMLNGMFVGGMRVPYAPATRIAWMPESRTFYLHLSGSGEIAEIDGSLDTLRTIALNLPAEEITQSERDSLLKEHDQIDRATLLEKLPSRKVPVEEMMAGPGGEIWLRLNYRGDTQQWLVLGRGGEPLYTVHLPKDSMLLHAGEHNLAVRLDDITLALFEGPERYREML